MNLPHRLASLTLRRLAACLAAFALLFAQLTVAAYACPMAAMPAMTASADCCDAAAQAADSLCPEHCKDAKTALPDAAPAIADFSPAFVVPLPPAVEPPVIREYSQDLPHRAASPPLAILNCCFRI